MVMYGVLVLVSVQLTIVSARCAITPNAQGHVTIPHGVKSIGRVAFYKCTTLKTVTLPDTITHIGNHSFQQSALETISIPSSVIDIGYAAFRSSIGLRSATIQVSSDPTVPANVKIGDFAFSRCSELTGLQNCIPGRIAQFNNQLLIRFIVCVTTECDCDCF